MGERLAASKRSYASFATLLLSTALVPAGHAFAANLNWQGDTDANWATGGNWDTGNAPTAADTVFINGASPNAPVIDAAGAVASKVTLGLNAGQTGTLTVDGGGLTVSTVADPNFVVGDLGTGVVTVENGGTLNSRLSYVGFDPGGIGTVTVTGGGSDWTTTNLYLGADVNAEGTVDVEAGASLHVNGGVQLAINSTTARGTLTVTGVGSSFTSTSVLYVGQLGIGQMTVSGGATAGAAVQLLLGVSAGSNGTLTVTGAGSTMSINGSVGVGNAGTGVLDIADGGTLTQTTASGSSIGALGSATVEDAGSLWQTTTLNVGNNTAGGTLVVRNGGQVTSSGGFVVGSRTVGGLVSGQATITGDGSSWAITRGLSVDTTTGAGLLSVLAGGALTSEDGVIGVTSGHSGKVTVSGTDAGSGAASSWTVAQNLTVAGSGTTGALEVKAGGEVQAASMNTLGTAAITVDGSGSLLTVNGSVTGMDLAAQAGGGTTTFTVSNGGDVVTTTTAAIPGNQVAVKIGTAATANVGVTGSGSGWTNTGGIAVGSGGTGTLTVSAGAHVTTGFLQIAGTGGGTGTVTVTGAGSLLDINDGVHDTDVGMFGNGKLQVLAGGRVETNAVTLAGWSAAAHGEVLVDGAGSTLVSSGEVRLGVFNAGKLTISNGGTVELTGVGGVNGDLSTGENPGVSGAQIVMNDGTLIVPGGVYVGINGAASLTASNGSVIQSARAGIGQIAGSNGTATLSGAGTSWTTTAQLAVGDAGAGTLTVENGATVNVGTFLTLGWSGGSSGALNVRNTGSSVNVGGTLLVGGFVAAGGSATATVSDGASLNVTGAAKIFSGGTLQIGAGGAPGAFQAPSLDDDGTLRFNHSGSLTFATPISGSGAITHTGTGLTVLTGTSTFAGTVSIDAGTLRVGNATPGALASAAFTVNSGGTLGGTGTIGAATINPGGIHAPGASIGVQTVGGAYVNRGILEIEASPAASDKVVVLGTVDIAGSTLRLVESPADGWQQSQSYLIIDNDAADAVTGTFTSIVDNYAFLDASVDYVGGTGNDVVLTIARNATAFPSVANTPNQIATAGAVEALGAGNPVYQAVLPLTVAQAPAAFDQLSGEIHASMATIVLDDSRTPREAALDRVGDAFGAPGNETGVRNIWGRALGDFGTIASDGNAGLVTFARGGFIAGIDGWAGDSVFLGAEAGFTVTQVSGADRSSSGSVDSAHFGIYGGAELDRLRLRLGAALSSHSLHVQRDPAFAGFSQSLGSDYSTLTAQAFGDLGYAFQVRGATLEPFVAAAFVHGRGAAYAETGGSAALTGAAAAIDVGVVTLGARGSADFAISNGRTAKASATIAWQGVIGATPTATHAFAGGAPFTVSAAPFASHLLFEAGLDIGLGERTGLDLDYRGAVGADGARHSVFATLHRNF